MAVVMEELKQYAKAQVVRPIYFDGRFHGIHNSCYSMPIQKNGSTLDSFHRNAVRKMTSEIGKDNLVIAEMTKDNCVVRDPDGDVIFYFSNE